MGSGSGRFRPEYIRIKTELRASRQPRLLFRFDGEFPSRFADRQLTGPLSQLSPRFTQFEP